MKNHILLIFLYQVNLFAPARLPNIKRDFVRVTRPSRKGVRPIVKLQQYLRAKYTLNQLNQHQLDTLNTGILRFTGTPGFIETTLQALTEKHVHGHLYEIEKALELHGDGFSINAFNQMVKIPHHRGIEFDLLAQKEGQEVWVECKNIAWHKKQDPRQFEMQKLTVDHQNRHSPYNVLYLIYSKRRLTDEWRSWFQARNIAIEEDE